MAGLTGRYRTNLDLPLRSDELIILRYHFTRTAISQRRTVSFCCGGLHMDIVERWLIVAAATSFLILVGTLTLL